MRVQRPLPKFGSRTHGPVPRRSSEPPNEDMTMIDITPESPNAEPKAPRRSRGRRTAFIAGIALAAGLAGAFASNAISKGRGWHHGGDGFGHHGGMGGMGFGFMGGKMSPEKAERHAERMAERFARRIDASGEQQSKLITIARETVKDIVPLRQQAGDARREAVKLMTAPQIDRAAIEKLRADQVAAMDAISKRMVKGIADAAEVLTPEQRQKVAERMEKRHERRGRWYRGEGRGPGEDRGPGEGRGPGGDGPAPEPKRQ